MDTPVPFREKQKCGRPVGSGVNPNVVHTSRNPGWKTPERPIAMTAEGKKVFAYNENGKHVCNSRIKKTGDEAQRCQSIFTMTNGRCKHHGGKAPSGILHYKTETLRSSSSMPSHLQGDMVAAMADEDRLSLNHEIALVDTKIKQQKLALETGLGGRAWKVLSDLASRLEWELEKNSINSEKTCEEIIHTIRNGVKEREVWKEIDVSLEVRRKLTETAHKREMNLKTMLKGDQAFALMTGIASICKEQIAKTMLAVEQRYKIVDRDTGIEVLKIDIAFKNDFLSSIGIALGRLVSKPDPNRDLPVYDGQTPV